MHLKAKIPWRSGAMLSVLRERQVIMGKIRHFFEQRGVWEVETPLLCHSAATDPQIQSYAIDLGMMKTPHKQCDPLDSGKAKEQLECAVGEKLYLQTSPEFAMKRLVAGGSGSIYQISKAFRREELGRWHHPEFTLLEWYRVGFDANQLMCEVDDLMQTILKTEPAERLTYAEIFDQYLGVDPHQASIATLQICATKQGIQPHALPEWMTQSRDFWLQLLLTHCIEPNLGKQKPLFMTEFPASQAALAKINPNRPETAERFELYFKGVELANGYHELTDAHQQRMRFEEDNKARQIMGLETMPMDGFLLAALEAGMPDCSGVAMGLDRLIMLSCGASSLEEVISFTWANA